MEEMITWHCKSKMTSKYVYLHLTCSAANICIYTTFGIVQSVSYLFASLMLAIGTIKASRRLHNGMLYNILRSPMLFFDTTPLGRLLNRFSKVTYEFASLYYEFLQDTSIIDEKIPLFLNAFLTTIFSTLSVITLISIASPWFLLAVIPITIFYLFVQVSGYHECSW